MELIIYKLIFTIIFCFRAGYKVTVVDTSDADWWKGKCLGRVGFFPSKYVTKLQSGERPLQVTHNLQVSDGDNGLMLLRDQVKLGEWSEWGFNVAHPRRPNFEKKNKQT